MTHSFQRTGHWHSFSNKVIKKPVKDARKNGEKDKVQDRKNHKTEVTLKFFFFQESFLMLHSFKVSLDNTPRLSFQIK